MRPAAARGGGGGGGSRERRRGGDHGHAGAVLRRAPALSARAGTGRACPAERPPPPPPPGSYSQRFKEAVGGTRPPLWAQRGSRDGDGEAGGALAWRARTRRASWRGSRSAAPEAVPRQTPPPPPSSAASRGASGSVSRGALGSPAGPTHASGFGGRIQAASHAEASRQARSHTYSNALSSVHLARRLRGLQKQGARRRQTRAAHNTHAAAPRTERRPGYRDGAVGGVSD